MKLCVRECQQKPNDLMVACSNAECLIEWFHYECAGMTADTVPKGDWFCFDCRKDEEEIEAMSSLSEIREAREKIELEMEKTKLRQMRANLLREKKEILREGARPKSPRSNRGPPSDNRFKASSAGAEPPMNKSKLALQKLLSEVGEAELEEDGLFAGLPEYGGKKLKSGYYDKASSEILYPQKWPQTGLKMGLDLSFSQLSCHTMVAGEIENIMSAIKTGGCGEEVMGSWNFSSFLCTLCQV